MGYSARNHPVAIDHFLDRALLKALFDGSGRTLGEAIREAKAAASDKDIRRTWILFGDPATRIK